MKLRNFGILKRESGGFEKMKQSQKIGKIDPVFKICTEIIDNYSEIIDDNYAFNDKYQEAYRGVRAALLNQKGLLVAKI